MKRKCRPLRTVYERKLKTSSGFGTCSFIPSSHEPNISPHSALQMLEFRHKKTPHWSTNTKENGGVHHSMISCDLDVSSRLELHHPGYHHTVSGKLALLSRQERDATRASGNRRPGTKPLGPLFIQNSVPTLLAPDLVATFHRHPRVAVTANISHRSFAA